MRKLLIIFCTCLFVSCKDKSPDPLLLEIDGLWELKKIIVGFTAHPGGTEVLPDFKETLEFKASQGTYKRMRDGEITGQSKVSISEDIMASRKRFIVVFEDRKKSAYVSLGETPEKLILEGRITEDAEPARFFYEKAK